MNQPPNTVVRRLARWGIAATIGIFFVNIIGFIDAETGSAYGCGQDWPLCNGKVIPQFTGLHVIIEFSHRALVVAGILLATGFLVTMWRQYHHEGLVRLLMAVAVFFLLTQSILGGLAVLFVNPPSILALHLGFGLMAMNAVGLLTAWLLRAPGRDTVACTSLPSPDVRGRVFGLWVYLFLVIYWGSYVSFRGAGQACHGWPLCNGQWFPGFSGLTGIIFAHRLAAVVLGGVAVWMGRAVLSDGTHPDLIAGARWFLGLILFQILSGAYLVWTHWALNAYIVHVIGVMALFYVASYLALFVDEPFWASLMR